MFALMVLFMTHYVKYIHKDLLPNAPLQIDNIPLVAVFLRYAVLLVRIVIVYRRYL